MMDSRYVSFGRRSLLSEFWLTYEYIIDKKNTSEDNCAGLGLAFGITCSFHPELTVKKPRIPIRESTLKDLQTTTWERKVTKLIQVFFSSQAKCSYIKVIFSRSSHLNCKLDIPGKL